MSAPKLRTFTADISIELSGTVTARVFAETPEEALAIFREARPEDLEFNVDEFVNTCDWDYGITGDTDDLELEHLTEVKD